MKNLLKNKNAMMLWFSRMFSRFGDAFESLALMYLVYELTGSALAMGTVMIFSVVPNLVVSPFAGVLGDRYNKKVIMVIAEMVRAVSILLVPMLHLTGMLQLWHIYSIVAFVSVAESFFEPSAQIVMVSAVDREQLPIYNSMVTTSNQIAKLAGFALSGILMRLIGMDILFIIDSITFVVSAITAALVKVAIIDINSLKGENNGEETEADSKEKESFFTSMLEGVKFVFKEKVILAVMLAIALDGMLFVPLTEFLPQVSVNVFHQTEAMSGCILTIVSLGSIVGSIVFPFLIKKNIKLKHFLLLGNATIGAVIIFSVWLQSSVMAIILYVVAGITISIICSWCSTELQSSCNINYLGRVSSLFSIMMIATDPLSATLSGWAIDRFSVGTVFMLTAILFVVLGIGLFIMFTPNKQNEVKHSMVAEAGN